MKLPLICALALVAVAHSGQAAVVNYSTVVNDSQKHSKTVAISIDYDDVLPAPSIGNLVVPAGSGIDIVWLNVQGLPAGPRHFDVHVATDADVFTGWQLGASWASHTVLSALANHQVLAQVDAPLRDILWPSTGDFALDFTENAEAVGHNYGFIAHWTPVVPEPASALLFAGGIGLLAFWQWRKHA